MAWPASPAVHPPAFLNSSPAGWAAGVPGAAAGPGTGRFCRASGSSALQGGFARSGSAEESMWVTWGAFLLPPCAHVLPCPTCCLAAGLCFPSPQQAVPEQTGPHGAGDAQSPEGPAVALGMGLCSCSAVCWSLRGGWGQGRDNNGKPGVRGLWPWPLFGRALPPPPVTRVREPGSCPPGDGFTGCLFASGCYFRGQAPNTATCRDRPDSSRGDPRCCPQAVLTARDGRSGCWVLRSVNKPTLFPASLSKTFHILQVFHSVFLHSCQGSVSPW